MRKQNFAYPVLTKWGSFTANFSERGLASINFPKNKTPHQTHKQASSRNAKTLKLLQENFGNYLRTGHADWKQIPIDKAGWTPLQKKVWSSLARIPAGETRTYEWLAKQCGMPRGARAAGNLLGKNPIPVIFPCHRIVRKDKSLGGFSGGLGWKRRLLQHEEFVSKG